MDKNYTLDVVIVLALLLEKQAAMLLPVVTFRYILCYVSLKMLAFGIAMQTLPISIIICVMRFAGDT